MKKPLFLLCFLFTVLVAKPQLTREQRIADSVIGWWPENKYDKLKPATDAVSRERTQILNNIVTWVKKSFTPVGGIGSYQRWTNSNNFGVAFDIWNVSSKLDVNGRYKPEGETNVTFRVDANTLPGSYPIEFMNKPGQDYYFIWQPDGYAENQQMLDKRQGADPRIGANAYPYLTRINEWHTVFLAPGNQLPVTPVTVEELLQQAEASLASVMDKAQKEAEQQSPGNSQAINNAVEYNRKIVDKYRDNIRKLRIKRAGKLKQQAVISAMQPTMYSFETDPDLFDINNWTGQQPLKRYYPVYKLTTSVLEKCKSAQPQWIAIYFPFKTQSDGNKNVEIFRALTQNLDYSYIYNYFYNPAKIKGLSYNPVDAAGLNARLEGYRNKHKKQASVATSKQAAWPAGTVLYDDFSQDAPETKPAGWFFSDRDKLSAITLLKDHPGHWLKLQYNFPLKPVSTKPLPKEFVLEFDVITDDFEEYTGGRIQLELLGSNKASGKAATSYFFLELTAGKAEAARENHNYRGLARIKMNNFPSTMPYNDQGGEASIAQQVFTNEQRKLHVTVRKQGGNISISLNGSELITTSGLKTKYGNKPCGDCSILPDIIFNKLSFQNMTQDADKTNAYVGNISIRSL